MSHLDENGRWQATPTFKRDADQQKYIDREFEKWVNGWGNLTGEHYFHLTYGYLQDIHGNRFRPLWRDGDALVFDSYSEAKKKKKDALYVKRREFGISSIFGGTVPFYNSLIHKGTTNVITSADVNRLNDIKNLKLRPIMEKASDENLMPSDNYYDTRGEIRFIDKANKNTLGSQILYRETSSSLSAASNLEGLRAAYIFLDEWFLHNRAEIVLETTRATMSKGFTKAGMIVMGGSCNAVNKEGIVRLQNIIKQSDALDIMITFIPGWMSMEGAMEERNGCYFSLKDKAIEMINKKRDQYRATGAYDSLDNYIKSYPLSIEELIESANASIFGERIRAKLNESKRLALEATFVQCNLVMKDNKPVTVPNPQGVFFIYDPPQPNHTYIAGGDPIPGNTENMDAKRSKFVVFIKDETTKQYVAYMEMRDSDLEIIYNKWAMLLYYYKSARYPEGAPCMFEFNRIGPIKQLCRMKNTMHLLAGDPEKIRKNYFDRGYYKGPGDTSAEKLDTIMKDYLANHTIQIGPLLDDLEKYPQKTDKSDAFQATEYFSSFFVSVQAENRKTNLRPVLKRRSDGKTYYDWQ